MGLVFLTEITTGFEVFDFNYKIANVDTIWTKFAYRAKGVRERERKRFLVRFNIREFMANIFIIHGIGRCFILTKLDLKMPYEIE